MRYIAPAAAGVPYSSPEMIRQRSPWQSPVPYLFGGVAAMLGLIAFALLILACSYWRLSTRRAAQRDLESGAEKDVDSDKVAKVYEEKILVIMAGDDTPTFLATPVCNSVSSIGYGNGKSVNSNETEKTENAEKTKNHQSEMAENTDENEVEDEPEESQ